MKIGLYLSMIARIRCHIDNKTDHVSGDTTARWRVHSLSPRTALKRVQSHMRLDEAGLLRAFDSNRDLICATAAKVYARGHKGSYDLVSSDF